MIVNLFVLVLIAGIVLGSVISAAAPSVVSAILTLLRIFPPGSLSFEKYEHIDTRNYKNQRSRYFYINREGYKNTVTAKVYFWTILILVLFTELIVSGALLLVLTV